MLQVGADLGAAGGARRCGGGLGLGGTAGVPAASRFLTGGSSGPVNAANRRSMDVVPVLNEALHACLPKPMATNLSKRAAARRRA